MWNNKIRIQSLVLEASEQNNAANPLKVLFGASLNASAQRIEEILNKILNKINKAHTTSLISVLQGFQ